MYQYVWDEETGGLLLTSEVSKFSKEPRPVYYRELDILGFDKYWNYPKDDSAPIMWAEANNYIYRGKTIAQTRGGSLYTAPKLVLMEDCESENELQFVHIPTMVERNRKIMESLAQETIQEVYNDYCDYKTKVDIFYVAYSGGKDSEVALDLVQRALPHDEFVVLFGDTQMEFSDTYRIVEDAKSRCEEQGIRFMVAKSEQTPSETWCEFGPPAQTLRWCCSVHKTSPQILLLRKFMGNPAFRGMAFTGIRGDESASRSQYDNISFGEKHKGQYSCHPILDWNSAEVFLYIFTNNLPINETYKKGNSRAGCLVCPLAATKNFYFKEVSYAKSNEDELLTTTFYNNIILETTSKVFDNKKAKDEFMDMCGWKARKSGKELNFAEDYCVENQNGTVLTIVLRRERTDWQEWVKTLGDIIDMTEKEIVIQYHKKKYEIQLSKTPKDERQFTVDVGYNTKDDIDFMSGLKIVLRKSAYCIGCHVCEANCPYGFIHMEKGEVKVDDRCVKCKKCHDVSYGCLVSNSLRLPKGVSKMGSVDRYGNIGIEFEWVVDYFDKRDGFWDDNDLGSNKIKYLRSFLEDAEVTKKHSFSDFGVAVSNIGIKTPTAWGLLISNLVYTSEFRWWVMNTQVGISYTQQQIMSMLGIDMSENSRSHIASAYKNIFVSNEILGKELGLGDCDYVLKNGKRILNYILRKSWLDPVPEVILYSLYKFVEASGERYQFTLEELMDDTIERDGISPTRIFGLDRDTMVRILNGLSVNYPEFLSASFTLDLDTVNLTQGKTSMDVLSLF